MYTVERLMGRVTGVRRLADGAVIPLAPDNADYQAFLAWNALQVPPLSLADTSPTQAELDKQADDAAGQADRADLKAQAAQALADIDAYLAIADAATNAQVRAEVKAIDQRQKRIIKALRRLA
jgi:crotonobetainyl-CoA:carnitine CoA-transferase CaiB-like acyl-CoA transferase